jgi:hypothetical protein
VEGRPVLKFALCYGFRNLQNFVRKIKMGKCEYHYIEVMACPSGTLFMHCIVQLLLVTYIWAVGSRYSTYALIITLQVV